MTERKLRRQRVILYVSRSLENTPATTTNGALREYYLTMLDQLEMEFTHIHHLLKEIFASAGTRVLPMSDLDHFKHYKSFLNPSLADRFDFDPASDFLPELSIQENCWHSEGNGQSDFGFYMDGHYHSVIALTRWPRSTYPGIIQRLTNLRLLDYAITVNVDPLPITQEINKEEKEHDRVAGDYASEKKISLLTVMEKKQKKIHALMQGQTIPFKALFVIRVWDKSKDGLNAKTGAIKNAINSMNSAQYFESNLPSTSRNLFFQTWPGWTWGRYEHRKLYSEHRYLADMLPVISTFAQVFVQVLHLGLFSGRGNPSNDAEAQRNSFIGMVKARGRTPAAGHRVVATSHQMQAAGLVGALRPLRTTRTYISFLDQPQLRSRKFGQRRACAHQLLHQSIERPFLREVDQQAGG